MSHLEVGLEKRVRLILLEELLVLLLVLGAPGLRWMFSDTDLLQNVSDVDLLQAFDCSICDWEYKIFTFHRR